MARLVDTTDTDINTHKSVTKQLYLKRHWALNAAKRPLSYTMGQSLSLVLLSLVRSKVA